jgi:dolichyl-phosphate beta-glucosyltransferase
MATHFVMGPRLLCGLIGPEALSGGFGREPSMGLARSTPVASIVIPAYNEDSRILTTVSEVTHRLNAICRSSAWEIIVADDGSTDSTANIVRGLQTNEPRIRLLSLPHRGKGATVRSGVLAASGEQVLFTDADLATPIMEARRLFDALDMGADIAIGSRAAPGASRLGEPVHREFMGLAFRYAVNFLLLDGFTDTQCGFKAFKRRVAQDVFHRMTLYNDDSPVIQHPSVTGFDIELLYVARQLGYLVHEVPVEWHYRSGSKVNPLRDSVSLMKDVLTVRRNARRGLYHNDVLPSNSPKDLDSHDPAQPLTVKDDPHVAG